MKTKFFNTLNKLALFLALACDESTLHAQGTAFTYQGRLNDGADLANGSYDLQFTASGQFGSCCSDG